MNAVSSYAVTERPLESLGITPSEESAYVALLDHPEATLAELASALAWPARKVQRLLDGLQGKGLVTFAAGEPRRFVPASPDIAIEAILSRREGELRRARAEIQRLQQRATEGAGKSRQMIELITTHEAGLRVFDQIQHAARHELIFLQRPPILIAGPEQPSATQVDALTRGVRYRSIADQALLAIPGVVARLRLDLEAGEEVRVVSALPLKMVMADRSVALIPLKLESPNSPSLLVRSSALLDALYSMFEILWERAAPMAVAATGTWQMSEPCTRLPPEADQLLPLLAAGLNDKAIAHELDISASTLTRRITDLMDRLDAQTRFQLGWMAARYGSLPEPREAGS